MTIVEAMHYGRSLPESMWHDYRGRPLMSRAEWEQLGRWRRLRDLALGRQPVKVRLTELPPLD
jgi:hypothetical protein